MQSSSASTRWANRFVMCVHAHVQFAARSPEFAGESGKSPSPRLLQRALAVTTVPEDMMFFDAEGLSKDRAREIENEARAAPRGGSACQTFFIYSLQKLPVESVGPLLKVTEDAKWSRFIFQAQTVPKKLYTLRSRSSVVSLPFLSKDVVLANLKGLCTAARF